MVDVTLARIKEVTKHSTNFNGPGNADYVVTMYELENCINLATCLLGKLPGVTFSGGWAYLQSSMLTTGASINSGQSPRMLIIVDGIEFGVGATESPLQLISPTDIASIELLKHPGTIGVYGSKGFAGVLIITTKTGDLMAGNKAVELFDVKKTVSKGFYMAREFYVPIYESAIARQNRIKDVRTTIHWDPNIVSDEQGKAPLEFFTADGPGTYLVTIEGIDLQGRIGRKSQIITVRE